MKLVNLFLLSIVMLWFTGCAVTSDHMTAVHKPLSPERNEASIVFIRASNYGAAVQATIYDGKEYIGTVSGMTKVAYHTEPGEHMFMVIGESADFMQATLLLVTLSMFVLINYRIKRA